MTRAMNIKKRIAFRPSIDNHKLEDRVVLSGGATASASAPIVNLTPAVTPRPALSPVSVRALMTSLHKAYALELKDAGTDLRKMVDADIKQMYATGGKPTAQQRADFIAQVDGAVDATALRVSAPASLLPGAGTTLVTTLQNDLLGTGSTSLMSRLSAVSQNAGAAVSAARLTTAFNQAVNASSARTLAATQTFLSTAPLAQSMVATTGQLVPLRQFMADQVLGQLENNLGLLAAEFPTVANAMLFPNTTTSTGTGATGTAGTTTTGTTGSTTTGTTGTSTTGTTGTTTTGTTGTTTGTTPTVSQTLLSQFGTQVNNALSTIAFVLGTELPLFSGSSSVTSQLDSALFGTSNGTTTSAGTTTTAGTTASSLATALADLQFGGSDLATNATNAFTTGLQNLVSPLATFFNVTSPADLALQTSNFTNAFASGFASPSFNAGFNNGFLTTTGANSVGLAGFGMPAFSSSTYNTNFGTGFSNLVNLLDTSAGFPSSGSSLIGTGITSTGQTSLTGTGTTGTSTGLTSVGTTSPGQTTTVGSGSL
jgi:hypothetical protein